MDTGEVKNNTKSAVNEIKTTAGPVNMEAGKKFNRPAMGERRKNIRSRTSRRDPRVKPEFDQKIIDIRRVARVVAGGRRFSFSVAMVIGNRKGSVGVGLGKGGDTALAIDKAMRDAKKNIVNVPFTKTMSIPHEIYAKYSSAEIYMSPAPGRGVIAGSAARNVLELAGVKDVVAKILSGSKNHLNIARVTIKAISKLGAPRRGQALKDAQPSQTVPNPSKI